MIKSTRAVAPLIANGGSSMLATTKAWRSERWNGPLELSPECNWGVSCIWRCARLAPHACS